MKKSVLLIFIIAMFLSVLMSVSVVATVGATCVTDLDCHIVDEFCDLTIDPSLCKDRFCDVADDCELYYPNINRCQEWECNNHYCSVVASNAAEDVDDKDCTTCNGETCVDCDTTRGTTHKCQTYWIDTCLTGIPTIKQNEPCWPPDGGIEIRDSQCVEYECAGTPQEPRCGWYRGQIDCETSPLKDPQCTDQYCFDGWCGDPTDYVGLRCTSDLISSNCYKCDTDGLCADPVDDGTRCDQCLTCKKSSDRKLSSCIGRLNCYPPEESGTDSGCPEKYICQDSYYAYPDILTGGCWCQEWFSDHQPYWQYPEIDPHEPNESPGGTSTK